MLLSLASTCWGCLALAILAGACRGLPGGAWSWARFLSAVQLFGPASNYAAGVLTAEPRLLSAQSEDKHLIRWCSASISRQPVACLLSSLAECFRRAAADVNEVSVVFLPRSRFWCST